MAPKRKPTSAGQDRSQSKKQKIDSGTEDWEQAAKDLKSLNNSFNDLKAQIETAVANERDKTAELEKQQRTNADLRYRLHEALTGKEEAEEELKREKEWAADTVRYASGIKAQYREAMKTIRNLERQQAEHEQLQEPRQRVLIAAGQVKDLIAGLPVRSMGPLREALSTLDTAFKDLSQVGSITGKGDEDAGD